MGYVIVFSCRNKVILFKFFCPQIIHLYKCYNNIKKILILGVVLIRKLNISLLHL